MSAVAATPTYDVGDVVFYTDRNGRPKTGKVQSIEASWRYGSGRPPLIIYDLWHPTYRDNRFYATGESIHSLSNVGRDA